MTEISENIVQEVDSMVKALESAKQDFHKKFKDIFDDYVDAAFTNFYNTIECDTRYSFERWIRQTCDEIIMGLLAGNTRWLKEQSIISEYSWEKLIKVRLAILKANGGEIENSTINSLQKEIEELKRENKNLRQYI